MAGSKALLILLVLGTTAAAVNAQAKGKVCPPFYNGGCTIDECSKGKDAGMPGKFKSFNVKKDGAGHLDDDGDCAVEGGTVKHAGDCCHLCRVTPHCVYWQYIPMDKFGSCYMMNAGMSPKCQNKDAFYDSPTVRVGGKCCPFVKNDPHFMGAQGTKFDFNGEPDRTFCLVSDEKVHINMLLRGYYDNRTEGASAMKNGKAIRTWIRELGVLWTDAQGVDHNMLLVARDGKKQERDEGFLARVEYDDMTVPGMHVGQEFNGEGGVTLKMEGYEKSGQFDVDFYTLKIAGLVDMDIRLRVAHPLLQTPTDAEAHINVGINSIKNTPSIHGVLGQTYRADHTKRAVDFTSLAALLHAPVQADGETGKGFLDGEAKDYESTGVLAADCKFSAYKATSVEDNSVLAAAQ
eukprot:jgi/Mesen1/5790/ME000293S04941